MSSTREWTPSQRLAMDTKGMTLLVSAAAGSGKTATLTERIIRRITDPVNPAELSRMLIVTFTRAAAAELKQRISDAISEKIAQDPGNRHLQKQLLHLGSAHIHTIDAFCFQPVRENFAEMGMPASFRIADDAELEPLSEHIMEDLISEFFIKYAPPSTQNTETGMFSLLEDNPFADLCDSLTASKDDASLTQTFKKLFKNLLNFPDELERLKNQAERLQIEAHQDFLLSEHGKHIKEWLLLFCTSKIQFFEDALATISLSSAATKAYYDGFDAELNFLKILEAELKNGTYASVQKLMQGYELGKITGLKNAEPIYVELKNKKTEFIAETRGFRDKYFCDTPEELSGQMLKLSKLCFVLYDYLTEYDKRMQEEKMRRGICDFTDNRRKLLRMLMDEDGQPTPLCLSYLENFDEVYIDEYQDVDEVQDTIFRLIGGDHRFMVGDIKQSIYGFRGADPSVFAGYRQTLTPIENGQDANGNCLFMSENFRCDEAVIRVTNAICSHIFSTCPDSIAYQPNDDLKLGKKPPYEGYVSPAVHIAVLSEADKDAPEDTLRGVSAEAYYVANQIAELLKSGATKANGEKILPGDIAILSRGATNFGEYMTALAALGIPTGCAELETQRAAKDTLHGPDMMYLLNLMRVINNPDNDIPLSEILRCSFPGLSLEDVITIRKCGDEHGSLYGALEAYLKDPAPKPELLKKVISFVSFVNDYRRLSISLSAEGLLRVMRQDSRVICSKTKAFTYLYDSARNCRVAPFVGLYTFLNYIENKILTSKNAPADQENQVDGGTVKLMTIHKSKGLEFPVCFVVRCGQDFSSKDFQKDLLFHKSIGISTKLYDRQSERKFDTTLRRAAIIPMREQTREDEMRILYVAMTRARERLYLVGFDTKDKSFTAGDRYASMTCNNYMAWIKAGLAAHPEAAPYYHMVELSEEQILPQSPLPPLEYLPTSPQEADLAAYYRHILECRIPPSDTTTLVRSVPTQVPASRMSRHLLDECVFITSDLPFGDEDKIPVSQQDGTLCHVKTIENIKRSVQLMASGSGENEFELLLKGNARPTAAEKGTAMHLFLQYCNWQNITTWGLESEISRLVEAGFMSERVGKILDRKQLSAFFDSTFVKSAVTATHIQRELKFQRFVPLRDLTQNQALAEALGDRTLYVRGSIDLVCHYADGHIEICDYKTDRITPEEKADPSLLAIHLKEKHGAQLAEYANAIEEQYHQRPHKIYIFSLPLGEAVEIDLHS